MWIMYVCFAALGLGASFFISKQVLKREHETTKTGLAEEEIKRLERRERRKGKKNNVRGEEEDLEKRGDRDGEEEIAGGVVVTSK